MDEHGFLLDKNGDTIPMQSNIENTTKRDPAMHLLGAGFGSGQDGMGNYIEEMEAAGAQQIAGQDFTDWVDVPQDGSSKLVDLGIELGERPDEYDGDVLFRKVRLPEGWRIDTSGHSMWTYIVDGEGYRRAAMFYKAAFYDRSAFVRVDEVPMTAAQSEAGNDFYDEGWIRDYPVVRVGPDLQVTHKPRFGDTTHDPDARRVLLVAPDGTIKSDETALQPPQTCETA